MANKLVTIMITFAFLLLIINISFVNASASSSDILGLESGKEYYIKRTESNKYLDVYNGKAQNHQNVQEYNFHGGKNQCWKISRSSDGRYKIASSLNNDYVLNIEGSNVDIYKNVSSEYQKFKVVRTGYGTYNIMNGKNYVTINSSENAVLSQNYPSGTWSFEKVEKGSADIYSFDYENGKLLGIFPTTYNSKGADKNFTTNCSSMGYKSFSNTNFPAVMSLSVIKDTDIYVHNGHGMEGGMAFYNSSDISGSWSFINVTDINKLTNNQLASLRVFISTGCKTGANTNTGIASASNNIVEAVYEKGAHFSLAWTENVNTSQGCHWVRSFFDKSSSGANIKECIEHADYWSYVGDKYYTGDTYARLKH